MIRGDERILIIKLSSIGDVVHTIPLVEVLKNNFPRLRIDWCVDEEICSLISCYNKLNRVIPCKRNKWKKSLLKPRTWANMLREVRFFVKELRESEYDIVLDIQGLFKSGILAGICRAERKIGCDGAREYGWIFVKETVPVNYEQHAIDRYLQVAKYLGCDQLSWRWPYCCTTESERNRVDKLLLSLNQKGLPMVAINPYSRWKTKLWPMERFSQLAQELAKKEILPLFTGAVQQRGLIDRIGCGINLAGMLNLRELSYLYSRVNAVISVDTGPMHIAVMSGAKVLALFGPTDPKRTGPYGDKHVVLRAELPCSPCFKRECETVKCMEAISVNEVINWLEVLLYPSPLKQGK